MTAFTFMLTAIFGASVTLIVYGALVAHSETRTRCQLKEAREHLRYIRTLVRTPDAPTERTFKEIEELCDDALTFDDDNRAAVSEAAKEVHLS